MSASTGVERLSVEEFAERFRDALIPATNTFSYFPAVPFSEEDVKDFVEEPVAALPPAVAAALRRVALLFVPYLERSNGKPKDGECGEVVCFEKPPENRQAWVAHTVLDDNTPSLVFAIKDRNVSDYHYHFYQAVARLMADVAGEEAFERYRALLREELSRGVHGEVDEKGWELKQALLRRQSNLRRETKLFREYARQSFIDTLTLYLHGICCDIDIEPGPRQLPSRYLRKRLEFFEGLYPPPEGYAVFPEELNRD
ncbi:MAG: hypothetical protein RMK57_09380 [Bryobacterales bacterium]|nr:hypothetical protein [Bryobacteraceae bacterium]MDW8354728.1 hypothetical protein [Bryobacterales bacterium]